MKYLVVGLGNVGAEYEGTRHNAGFMVLDALLGASSTVSFRPERLGSVAEVSHRGRTLVLLKPSTYMNLSGKAVQYWMQRERVPLARLLVVVDDLALPLGGVRLRAKGSDGGHNGLKHIQSVLQSAAYPRLRVGIGSDFARGRQVDYVLTPFAQDERGALASALERAAQAVLTFATQPIDRAMSIVNTAPGTLG